MSIPKNRAFSANRIQGPARHFQKQRRCYDRQLTEQTDSFIREPTHKYFNTVKDQGVKLSKMLPKKCTKPAEEVNEQNLGLKLVINDLQEQLCIQRSKIQLQKKKTHVYSRQLNRQFQKEMYYVGKKPNSYLISGIKHQYENMKQLYEEKCMQNEDLRKGVELSKIEQINIYIENLEVQNKLLVEKLEHFIKVKKQFEDNIQDRLQSRPKAQSHKKGKRMKTEDLEPKNENIFLEDALYLRSSYYEQNQINILSSLLAQEQLNHKKARSLAERYNQKVKQTESLLREANKKISFLEKVIIQKDNNQHHARKLYKNCQRQKNQILHLNATLERTIQNQRAKFQNDLEDLKNKQMRKYEVQKSIFQNNILEKKENIQKLEKQIRFLSTLLSYWKPLDELNRQYNRDYSKVLGEGIAKDLSKDHSDKYEIDPASESAVIRINEVPRKGSMNSDQILPGFDGHLSTEHQKDHSFKSQKGEERWGLRAQSQQDIRAVLRAQQQKIPQSCSQKHRETAKKCRKVQLSEVKASTELIRFRLIGYCVEIQQVKELFDFKGDIQNQEERRFSEQYISMGEVKQILKKHPFRLQEDQAFILSRYLVEDSTAEHVYCDEGNQIKRSIVKSIIKTVVGDYEVLEASQIQRQWQQIKKIYGSNMQLALKSIAGKGTISLHKFLELINGLGIETSESVKEWLIGEMIKVSPSLDQLNYSILFEASP